VRIILIDFWDGAALIQRKLFYAVVIGFFVTFIPTAILMLRPLY
jgi:hypothetical protein